MQEHPLEARVSVVESKVDALESEALRTRSRLHDVESDRATVRFLAQQMRDLAQQIEAVATRAAEKALGTALRMRDDEEDKRSSRRLEMLGIGTALGGLVTAVVGLALHYL